MDVMLVTSKLQSLTKQDEGYSLDLRNEDQDNAEQSN